MVIQNIIAPASLGRRFGWRDTLDDHQCQFVRPSVPDLIHRMPTLRTVMLLFASGKLVRIGVKAESDVYCTMNSLHVMVEEKKLIIS